MKQEYIFYSIGGLFVTMAVLYLTWEFLLDLSKEVKLTILFLLVGVFFLLGKWLSGRGW